MQLNMHDVYDNKGIVKEDMSKWVLGHRSLVALLPNLHLLNQHIQAKDNIVFNETATRGLYFTLLGNGPIQNVTDIDSVQISYQPKDISGQFAMRKNEGRSLIQIYISPSQLAAVLGESEDQIIQHFTVMQDTLGNEKPFVELPLTEKMSNACKPILAHQGHSISLAGHLYALIFTLIEQLQMLNHLSQCEECQSKLYQAQNLLEVPNQEVLCISKLAQDIGLNNDALTIGFFHMVGQTIESYCMKSRIKFAAAILRKDPDATSYIAAKIGFSEDQFEAAFVKQFGVSSHHYGQIH